MPKPANPPINVTPLNTPSASPKRTAGRPANLIMPPLPQEILDGMSDIEQQHYEFFRDSYTQAYTAKYQKQPPPTAQIFIVQAALDYINLLRLQAEQMSSHTIVSQARQHPGVQVRAWLTSIGLEEKNNEDTKNKTDDKSEARDILMSLSKKSS